MKARHGRCVPLSVSQRAAAFALTWMVMAFGGCCGFGFSCSLIAVLYSSASSLVRAASS